MVNSANTALVLAVMLVLVGTAWAETTPATLTNGEVGGYNQPDIQNLDNKSVNIPKEITVYNKDETYVYGPSITYTYTVTPASGTELKKITDDTSDHSTSTAIETTVLSGITTGLTVNGGSAGSATSAVGTLIWSNTDILEASDNGTANIKYIPLNFSNVVFTQPGVYRYKITETTTSPSTSAAAGITTASNRTRYLDVYVMRSTNYDDTHRTSNPTSFIAGDWKIYGYVCMDNTTNNVTSSTSKTNGFVDSDTAATASNADQYFTYNVTLTKDVVNDSTMVNHPFPFNVAFTNSTATGTFQLIAEKTGTATTISTTEEAVTTTVNGNTISGKILKIGSAAALSEFNNAGDPHVADENETTGTTTGSIKYIGIPAGTKVDVYETNDVIGTTYAYTHKVDTGTASTSANVYYNANTATNLATLAATTLDADDDTAHTIAFTNTLQQISPTGYVTRFAPYALILIAGIALMVVAMKRRKTTDEE